MARRNPMLGLLVPLVDDLQLVGSGTTDSSYTQAGPQPGISSSADDPAWRVVVTGAQSTSIDWLVTDGGFPDRGTGMKVVARVGDVVPSPNEQDWHGWSEPNLIAGTTCPSDYQAKPWDRWAAARRSDTGELVVVGADASDTTAGRSWSYDPRTETWTTRYDFGANQGLASPIAMLEDPEKPGRMLLWSGVGPETNDANTVAYYSEDSGATWTIFARGTGPTWATERMAVAARAGQDWLRWTQQTATGARQEASADKGVTWEVVGAYSFADYTTESRYSAVWGPRGYVVGYLTDTDRYPAVRVIGSARTALSSVDEQILQTTIASDIVLSVDDDGSIYALVTSDASAVGGQIRCWRSDDGGYTWRQYSRQLHGFPSVDVNAPFAAVPVWSLGQLYVIGQDSATTYGLQALICGGWSNVDQGQTAGTDALNRQTRFGWLSDGAGTGEAGVTYTPYNTGAGMGWTEAATATLSMTNGGRQVAAAAGQTWSLSAALGAATAYDYLCGGARVHLTAGRTAATSTVYVASRVQDAAATAYPLRIYLGTDGIEIRDGAVTVRQAIAIANMTTLYLDLRWQVRHGAFSVWYRQQGTGTKWTRAATEEVSTSAAFGTSAVSANIDAAASGQTLVLKFLAAALECDWRIGIDDADQMDLDPTAGPRGIRFGRALGPAEMRYPCPLLGVAGDDVGFLHATGGPSLWGEEGEVDVDYRWPAEAVQPWTEPSPRLGWRATGTAEAKWSYGTAAEPHWRAGAYALVAQLGSFRTCALEIDNGGGGWSTLGTLDKGQNAPYALSGREVRPGGASNLTRYVARNELVGGYFIFANGGAGVARRIVANAPGYWTTNTVQQIRVEVEGVDGSETASATGVLVHPSGVLVVYTASDTARAHIRIRIPSGQVVPADRGADGLTQAYDAGVLFAARIVGIGTPAEWSTGRRVEMPAVVSRRRDGTPSMARTGPARRTWAYAWGPSLAGKMRLLATGPDYIAASGGAPIGTWQDAWAELAATVDELSGQAIAVVGQLPDADSTLTDPSEWIYGLVTSTSFDGSAGVGTREGEAELLPIGPLVVEELP